MDLKEQALETAKTLQGFESDATMRTYLEVEVDGMPFAEAEKLLLLTEDQCNLSTLKNAKKAAAIAKAVRATLKKV